ncbi:MAG: DNA gyrase inhibitor YacG [Pseudomonadota bacterium]
MTQKSRKSRCPICNAETVQAYRPFCSKRCADIDLGRWLGGNYAVPDRAVNEDDDWSSDSDEVARVEGELPPRRLN